MVFVDARGVFCKAKDSSINWPDFIGVHDDLRLIGYKVTEGRLVEVEGVVVKIPPLDPRECLQRELEQKRLGGG